MSQLAYVLDDAIHVPSLKARIKLDVVHMVGLIGFFFALLYYLGFNWTSFQYTMFGMVLGGKTISLAISALCFILLGIVFRFSSHHAKILHILIPLTAVFGLITFILVIICRYTEWIIVLVSLGVLMGFFMMLWAYFLTVSQKRNEEVPYRTVSLAVIGAGALMGLMSFVDTAITLPSDLVILMISLGSNGTLLLTVRRSSDETEVRRVVPETVQHVESLIGVKALIYIFAYSFVLAWGMSFQVTSTQTEIIFSVCIIAAAVLLYFIWLKNGILPVFRNTIRFYLPVTVLVTGMFAIWFPSSLCFIPLVICDVWSLLFIVLRIGYVLKVGTLTVGFYASTITVMLMTLFLGVGAGFIVWDVCFANAIANGPMIAVHLNAVIAIVAVVVGVGRGGLNLQSESIRSKEENQATEQVKRRYYEEACALFTEDYELTPRQAEILDYLGKGRNARFIMEQLCISEHTVNSHIYCIYKKAQVHSQQDIMRMLDHYCDELKH